MLAKEALSKQAMPRFRFRWMLFADIADSSNEWLFFQMTHSSRFSGLFLEYQQFKAESGALAFLGLACMLTFQQAAMDPARYDVPPGTKYVASVKSSGGQQLDAEGSKGRVMNPDSQQAVHIFFVGWRTLSPCHSLPFAGCFEHNMYIFASKTVKVQYPVLRHILFTST